MQIIKKKIRKLEKKIFTQNPKALIKTESKKKDFKIINSINSIKLKVYNFGNLNPDKIFYVIKRSPGAGLFSNVAFVLNHLIIAYKNNYLPFVDMERNPTIYNEKIKINKTFNAWEYYFENLNKHTPDEIYKSRNVIITENVFDKTFEKWISKNPEIVKILNKKIKFKKNIYFLFNFFKRKLFDKKKILGVHFRGTSYKSSPGHPLPATKKQMFNMVNYIFSKEKIDKIFLSTEEKNYLKFFLKKFPGKVIFFSSSYRSNKNDAFDIYPRNKHRYKLGREILLETLLLSCSNYFLYTTSNVSEFALSLQLNKRQIRYKIDNGTNSMSKFKSSWYWYVKSVLPEKLGGFKK